MEAYITAKLELFDMDEDVITASVVRCVEFTGDMDGRPFTGWTVYFSDGNSEDFSYYPDLCD